MKKIMLLVIGLMVASIHRSYAQSQEIQQLVLDIAKLAQFKQILTDLKKGYEIVSTGYTTVKDLSQGNFDLHKSFLDGLMAVSPTVRKYKRITDIINDQIKIVSEYKAAYSRYKSDKNFNVDELDYLGKVYSNLFNKSLNDLDELTIVVTENKLRMSDDERITEIDRIHNNMQEKLVFLRQFNNKTTVLAVQRAKERNDAETMQKIYGVKN